MPRVDSTTLLDELPGLEASARVARINDAGPPDDVLRELAAAAEQLAVTDAGRALTATDCLVSVADELAAGAARSAILRARGSALCHAGRLEEGWRCCDESARLAEQDGRLVESGQARLRSMQALGELGRFEESIAAGEAARQAFEVAGEDQLAARAEVNLGAVCQRRDDPARAMEYFDRARPRLGDAALALGTVDNNRGEALLALNDFEGAEEAFRSSLKYCERAGAELSAAVVEGNLADLATRRGLLHRAVHHFELARRRLESAGSSGHLARLLTEQAEAMSVLGLPADALALYEAALPQLDRAGQALEAARARAGLGRVLGRLGRPSEAQTALAAAAGGFDDLGHATAKARVDLLRAELAAVNGRRDEARRLIHGALAVLHDRPIDAATARLLLGRVALTDGALDVAESELNGALAIVRRLDLAPLAADVRHALGQLRLRRGDMASAVKHLEAAAAQVERVRGALNARRFRAAYLGDRLAVYDDLILALLDQGAEDAAARTFAVAEQAKSRLLLEQVAGELEAAEQADERLDASQRDLADEHARLRGSLDALYSRLADDEVGAAVIAGDWQRTVLETERRLEELEGRLSAVRGVAGLYARPVTLESASAALPPGTTMLEYVVARDEVIAFVVGRGRRAVRRRLMSAAALTERASRLQFQINRALRRGTMAGWRAERLHADARAELAALDEALLAPLRDLIPPGGPLLIVPHGVLHLLPFHALWDGRRYLIEGHEVHYAPSASLYVQLAARRRHAATRSVVVGVADAAAPRIETEAVRVARLLAADDDDVLIGEGATARRFGERAGSAGLLHLACHARFAPGTPLGSGLRLADRWLTVHDLYAMKLEADLVTLAGCETGRSQVRAGDELVGLMRGFFAAGAASLLLSLWRVDDATALSTMTGFYDRWRAGTSPSKASALREAQLAVLADNPHPALWAPFRLVGQP